jgi:hypothetical protein
MGNQEKPAGKLEEFFWPLYIIVSLKISVSDFKLISSHFERMTRNESNHPRAMAMANLVARLIPICCCVLLGPTQSVTNSQNPIWWSHVKTLIYTEIPEFSRSVFRFGPHSVVESHIPRIVTGNVEVGTSCGFMALHAPSRVGPRPPVPNLTEIWLKFGDTGHVT